MRNIGPTTNLLWSFSPTAVRALSTAVAVMATACGGGGNPSPVINTPPVEQATPAGCVRGSETLSIVTGNGQTARPGSLLPEPATVRVTCESFANRGTTIPVVGVTMRWLAKNNAGPIWLAYSPSLVDGASSTTTQTDSSGTSSVAWTLASNFSLQGVDVFFVNSRGEDVGVNFNARVTATMTAATTCQDAGGTDHGALTVTAVDMAWTAAGSPHRGGTIRLDNNARLAIEAGAVICLAEIAGPVRAEGTAQVPVRFFGTSMPIQPILWHALVENAIKVGSVTTPSPYIADSTLRWTTARDPLACAQVVATEVYGVRISGYGSQECAALHLVASETGFYGPFAAVRARIVDSVGDGVFVPGSVGEFALFECEISSSGRHGIVVSPPAFGAPIGTQGVYASFCNLFGNRGDAIHNQSSITVGAGSNWWGDPAGPLGASGDGTSGNVDASNPSPAPLSLSW